MAKALTFKAFSRENARGLPESWSDMERSFCFTGFYHEIAPSDGPPNVVPSNLGFGKRMSPLPSFVFGSHCSVKQARVGS